MRVALGLLVCGAALLLTRPAFAQESDVAARAAARKLGSAGIESYRASDFTAAADRLDKAYRILRVPSLGLWSARAFVELGRLLDASERYLEVTRLSAAGGDQRIQEQAKLDARKEYDALAPRIPNLVVKLEGATADRVSISVDGKPVRRELIGEAAPVDPGLHKVVGVRGTETVEVDVTLAEGREEVAVLRFDPSAAVAAPPSEPASATPAASSPSAAGVAADAGEEPAREHGGGSALPVLGWIGIGVGGAAIAAGGITGAMALEKKADLTASGECDAGCQDTGRYRNFNTLRTTSTVCFVAGGVLAATGIVLLVVAPSESSVKVGLTVAPSSATLSGTF